MRGEHLWIGAGGVLSVLGIVLLILALKAEQTYIACETSVPHVACAMPAFGFFFLSSAIPILGGLTMMLYGIYKLTQSARGGRGTGRPSS
jgi:hypothetical protein